MSAVAAASAGPGRVSAGTARGAQAPAPLLRRLFRAYLHGLERLPEGTLLPAASHSAGIGPESCAAGGR